MRELDYYEKYFEQIVKNSPFIKDEIKFWKTIYFGNIILLYDLILEKYLVNCYMTIIDFTAFITI